MDLGGRPELERQYDRVLAEYRFQVTLNWDRAKHYLAFNTVIIGAAVALYDASDRGVPRVGVITLLGIAAANSLIGQHAVGLGQVYYRSIRDTKARLEQALGLDKFAILSTPGMKRELGAALAGTPHAGLGRWSKINVMMRGLLLLIALLAGTGASLIALDSL
jgi:hypothetical protein